MYYTEQRFQNWLERIKEEKIDLDKAEGLEIFDQMLEDFVVACFNILKAIKNREITKKEALEEIKNMERIIKKGFDFGDDVKNELYQMITESLKIVLRSAEIAIEGKISRKSFEKLFNEAIKKEKNGDLDGAFESIAMMGAKIFRGDKLPEIEIPDEDLYILGWFDGVDAINMTILLSEIDRDRDMDRDIDKEDKDVEIDVEDRDKNE